MGYDTVNIAHFLEVTPQDVLVLPNPGGGHCFFYALAQALCNVIINANEPLNDHVLKLRKLVSDGMNEEMFTQYKWLLENAKNEYALAAAKRNSAMMSSSTEELARCGFVKSCKTVSEARMKVMTSEYWADEMSISILQKVLGVGILTITPKFGKNDGTLSLSIVDVLETLKSSKKFVIMLMKNAHYELISVKGMLTWTFSTLPISLKRMLQQRVSSIVSEPTDVLLPTVIENDSPNVSSKKVKSLQRAKEEVAKRYPNPKFFMYSTAVPEIVQREPFKRHVNYGRYGKPVASVGKYLPTKTVNRKPLAQVRIPTVVRSTKVIHK